ncbi:NUDIX hydrolase [Streptomyces eurocidicus]|uniref:8-oxo-dGTP pyrophosphatase MutT (NUDIX family) n=1 Tax=Streptomyces eurocidicus TaxID=66423 RepID=A0A7W8F5C4_STREU|nr:NUDIX hydrolase [Streptomyces eurocidicus]MBB5121231.1 8-oxo-dGTP pyrophosphatase MutT (NUDIX family) [Streptomyces eurocidicus]
MREVLDLPDASPTSREEFRGHVTAGAVLMDGQGRVLRIHHRSLNTWLFPGGHLEAGDRSLAGAALRELCEETGIATESVTAVDAVPVDIDVHDIPENRAKAEPEHTHFDFRYVFRTCSPELSPQYEEVTDVRWFPVEDIPDERLRSRVQGFPDRSENPASR